MGENQNEPGELTVANCKYCGKSITWVKEGRRNVPFEDDGVIHECEEYKKSRRSIKDLQRSTLSPEEIARYEQGINTSKK